MPTIRELAQQRAELAKANQSLISAADAESRRLNTEEAAEYDRRDAEIDRLESEIEAIKADQARRDRLATLAADLEKPLPRQTASAAVENLGPKTMKWGRNEISLTGKLAALSTQQYAEAFRSYLSGDARNFESLGLIVGDDSKGGYAVPTAFASTLVKFVDDLTVVRQISTVLPPTTAKSVGVLSYDTDLNDADWTPEVPASDLTEDDSIRFGKREMMPHLLTKLVKASQMMLRSSSIPLESFLAQRLGYKFAISQEKAFLTGTGVQRPLGLFTANNDGIGTARDKTGAATTSFTADNVIDTFYSLKEQYQPRASWLMHRDVKTFIRKLKVASTTGGNDLEYIWQPGLAGAPDTLLGRPIYTSEYAPNTFTTGQYMLICGDFSYYYIQDGMTLEVQRFNELFGLRNQIGWKASMSVDAQPVLAEAFARLKLA